jgi:16S rRNA (guanine966-N2)-methyltransferase
MRIIGGTRRGLKLAEVGAGDTAAHLRPTSDRVREAIFNLLINAHGNPVTGARVLDLFAGTGALGLEALSRGAAEATFVDDGQAALALLKANIAKMRAEGQTRILRQDATRLPPNAAAPYTLVFLDPPYGKGMGKLPLPPRKRAAGLPPGRSWSGKRPSPPPFPKGSPRSTSAAMAIPSSPC